MAPRALPLSTSMNPLRFNPSPTVPLTFNRNRTETGFVVGGGGEYRVLPNTSLGAEGLFYDFGSSSTLLSTPPEVGGEPFVFKDDLNFWVVRGRLTYYFNDH